MVKTIRVTRKIREARMDECKKCPKYSPLLGGICKQCGCSMIAKTWLKGAECPLKKW